MSLLREYIKELLAESVEFHELDSPLDYSRASNVKRLAYCDTSVTEPPIKPRPVFHGIPRNGALRPDWSTSQEATPRKNSSRRFERLCYRLS